MPGRYQLLGFLLYCFRYCLSTERSGTCICSDLYRMGGWSYIYMIFYYVKGTYMSLRGENRGGMLCRDAPEVIAALIIY